MSDERPDVRGGVAARGPIEIQDRNSVSGDQHLTGGKITVNRPVQARRPHEFAGQPSDESIQSLGKVGTDGSKVGGEPEQRGRLDVPPERRQARGVLGVQVCERSPDRCERAEIRIGIRHGLAQNATRQPLVQQEPAAVRLAEAPRPAKRSVPPEGGHVPLRQGILAFGVELEHGDRPVPAEPTSDIAPLGQVPQLVEGAVPQVGSVGHW